MKSARALLCGLLTISGNALTLLGTAALVVAIAAGPAGAGAGAAWAAFLPGVRAAASLAIVGCLLSAVGYGIEDQRQAPNSREGSDVQEI